MLAAIFQDGLLEGWEKLGVFAVIVVLLFGFLFSLMKFSKWREKSQSKKRRFSGVNRKERRREHAWQRKRRR